jgi:PAS domain S-box-containing protein
MVSRLKNISLKTKMALSVSLLFVSFGAIMAFFTLSYFERKYDETIARHQYALVSALAFGIDNKLRMAQTALIGTAARITPEITRDPEKARLYLDSRPTLLALFDDGIFLISREGKVLAESSGHPHQQGENKPFREFYRKTLATGKPYISNHYTSPHRPGDPAIFMTAPLFDSRGGIYAVLGGSIDLQGNNLLEEFSRVRIGKTGYIALCDQDRTIIVHPDKKRLLERVPRGVNKLFDRAVAGYEGSGKTINSRGVGMLTSFKQLDTNDWFVVANLPMEEAYASLYEARRYFVLGTCLATAAILLIAWLMMRELTAPLMAITGHVQSLQEKAGEEKLIDMDRGDEIGTLALAFNDMITAIEMQQDALRESRRRFHETLEHVRLIAVMLDTHGNIVFCNDFLLELTGYRRDELMGQDFFAALIPADVRDEAKERFRKMIEAGDVTSFQESEIVSRPGERRTILWNNTTLRDVNENVLGTSSLGEDITDRKKAEEAIRGLNRDLQQRATELSVTNKDLEAFSYSLSHDLKTPLTSMSVAAQCLTDDYAQSLDENGKFFVESIRAGCSRIDKLIDAMLALSRLSRRELRDERVDLSQLARKVTLELRMAHPERQVEFIIADGLTARGDQNMLEVVLENLIGNAWKYTGRAQAPVIEFGVAELNGEKAFFVHDNGAGFAMEAADKLFQPFTRLHRDEEFTGTGIGLATVQKIMARHGGKVWAEGEPDKGASFYFTLPGS